MVEKDYKNEPENSLIGLIKKLEKSANIGFWEKNLQTGEYFWSDQFFEIFGLDPDKDQPDESLRLSCIHPEDREKSKHAYQKAIETGQSFKIEKRILRPDGELRYVVSESHIEKNKQGLPVKVYGIIKDVSSEKFLAEKAERKNKELQSFFKNSKDLLIELDWDGIILNISESSLQNLGYHPEELIGTYMKELVFPEDLSETIQASQKVRKGESISDFKNRYIHKNGTIVNLEWSISTDPENKVLFLLARNINEKIEREKETEVLLERLNRAQKTAKLGYWELDLSSGNLYWSDEVYRIWEISPEIDPNFNFFKNTIHPDDRGAFLAAQERALSDSESLDYVHRIVLKSGQIKYIHERANLYTHPESGKQVFRGTVQDITAEKLIENELKSRNHFIESTLENLSIGVAVNEISSGNATFMNKAFTEIYGWPKSIIKDVESFFKSIYPDPEYRAKISNQIFRDMQSGDPDRMNWRDIFITTKGGKQKVISAKNIPIFDQDLMISTVWDETDRYWAEHTLKKSNERFHLATQAITDAIFDWNILGKKIFWGKGYHRLFGYPEDMEYVPEGFWEQCVHPDDFPELMKTIVEARNNPSVSKWKGFYRFKKADGTYAFVKEQTSIQRDKNGNPIRIVGALQDITQEKVREKALAQKTLFIQKAAECAQLFLAAGNWEDIMDNVLRIMGETLQVDRSYLLRKIQDQNGREYVRYDYEWTNGKVTEEIHNPAYQAIPIDEHPLLVRDFSAKRPFAILLKDATGPTKQIMAEQDILSMLNVPVYVHGEYFAHVGFDSCLEERIWTEEEKDFVQSIINSLTLAIERHETLSRLAEALENNSNILESIGEAFYSLDEKYRFTYWNYQAEKLTGINRKDVIHKNIWEVFGDKIHPDFAKHIKVAMVTKLQIEFEIEDPFTNAWLEISVYPRTVGLSIFIRNITERKRAEQEIAEFNERFSIISNTSHDAIWDWDLFTGNVLRSQSFEQHFGFSPEEQKKDVNFWKNLIHPDDRPKIQKSLTETLESDAKHWKAEFRVRDKDGKYRYIIDSGYILRDKEGKAVRMIGAIQEITERKLAELALASEKERLIRVIEGTEAGTWEWNIQTGEIIFNEEWARILGYKLHELEPISIKTWESLLHPEDLPIAQKALENHFSGLTSFYQTEIRLRHKEGHWVWILGRGRVMKKADDGSPLWMFGTQIDISEKKAKEEALERLNERLQSTNSELKIFASVASHDMREPLRMISSFLSLIQKKYAEKLDEKGNQYIDFAVDGAKRLSRLIEDLLEYSRIGFDPINKESVDIGKIIDTIININKQSIEAKGAEIRTENLPVIKAVRVPLQQLFHNLITNSLKFVKENSKPIISIKCDELENFWQFTVEDNGIGIDKKDHDKVFGVMKRLHSKDKYDGTGIGLAICKMIVEQHSGEIWIESEINQGTKFIFTIKKT